jgi:S-adenosyl methyltransferase
MASERGDEAVAGGSTQVPFDTSVAHIARVYNYWLGGKDNFAADRAAGDVSMRAFPGIVSSVRANRAFLARAVRYLAAEAGISQFLDIGTGIPSANNTHEVAQAADPSSRVLYVDNDPIVLTHARALLASHPEGATEYIEADLRDPQRILAEAVTVLDFRRPVAVMLMAILQVIGDDEDPNAIVSALVEAVPRGSYLVLSHPASDIDPEAVSTMVTGLNRTLAQTITPRDHRAVLTFFDGLELLDPGVVPAPRWRSAPGEDPDLPASLWAGVALKR